ncbi:DUF2911 domain-containing protein [Flavobacterium johnsoniae]|uniref:DUF2911 domain-containing protein n=1 Tax=Flavobacterium johnsoniae TaxID=986 RepID=UPI0011EF0F66|nr:DUF2911 domain-containing protein [Flavobacterium johnsoniae]
MKKTKTILASFLVLLALASCAKKENKAEDSSSGHHHQTADVNGEQYAMKVNNGTIKNDTLKGSPERTAMGFVDGSHIHIEYSSPGTRGRVIWGGLVPLDHLWVTGAHSATRISFSKDVNINSKRIKAGEYAFFTIPGKESWTLIFNTKARQHLTDDYDQKDDALRLEVTPEKLAQPVQRLTYRVKELSQREGTVSMEWEYLKISFSITPADAK